MIRARIAIEKLDVSLSVLRLTRPDQITSMHDSLHRLGQWSPVVVRTIQAGYQLLDGFKRYYASQGLGWDQLHTHAVEANEVQARSMILSYNQQGTSLVDYEEAPNVYNLNKEHLLTQKR